MNPDPNSSESARTTIAAIGLAALILIIPLLVFGYGTTTPQSGVFTGTNSAASGTINMGGHSITNGATYSATNGYFNNIAVMNGITGPIATTNLVGIVTNSVSAASVTSALFTGNASALTNFPSASTMGLGTAATNSASAFDTNGAAAAVLSTSLQKSNNLSDLTSASTARTNLGLGTLSTSNSINNSNWSGAVLGTTNGGTGTNTITGWLYGNGTNPIGPAPDQHVALTDTTNVYSANQTLDGTNNVLPQQVGVYPPGASTAMTYDQTVFQILSGYHDWTSSALNGGPFVLTSTNSGSATYYPNFSGFTSMNSSSTTNSGGLCLYESSQALQGQVGNVPWRTADFSQKMTLVVNFFWEGTSACPNTVCRCMFGKYLLAGNSASYGAPTVPAIGFKCIMSTANSAVIYGEVYNGSLNTSSALATIDSSSANYLHTVIMRSNGSGTVTYYVDGAYGGTLTGAPNAVSSGGVSDTFECEVFNTSDASALGNFITFIPRTFLGL